MGQLKVSDNASTTLAASLTSNPAVTSMTLADNAANTLTIVRGTAMGLSGYTDADCKAWASTTTGVACRMIAGAFNDIAGAAASATSSAASAAAAVAPLAAVSGIVKGNGAGVYSAAVANTDYTKFASGTRLIFAQSSAPTGWTQDTTDTANNRMLRVVVFGGGGVGGYHDPAVNNVVPAHTHSFSTGYQSADHAHYTSTGGASASHSHGVVDPTHNHSVPLPVGMAGGGVWGGANDYNQGSATLYTNGNGTGIWLGGADTDHYHSGWSGGVSANHIHYGATDNGSSQTNWYPRYLDTIVCTKD